MSIMKVTGPINIVRLISHDTKKELYLFFDYHADLDDQTSCHDNKNSLHLVEFFDRLFKANSTIMYDFFLEVSPGKAVGPPHSDSNKHTYIEALEAWLTRNFEINNKGKAIGSRKYPNVRFHYIDIRQFFEDIRDDRVHRGTIESLCGDSSNYLRELLDTVNEHLSGRCSTNHAKHGKCMWSRQYFIDKVMHKYNSTENLKQMHKYVRGTLLPFLNKAYRYIRKKCPKVMDYLMQETETTSDGEARPDNDRIYYRLLDFIEKVSAYWIDALVYLVDLYFIRRFVDKDYVQHAFLYSGCYHSINVITILVRYFGYKVTHADYCTIPLDDLNTSILERKDDDPTHLIAKLWRPRFYQCSSITGLPFHL